MKETEKTLTVKQRLFIKEYLIDFNGTQAAIRAGYSKKTAQQVASENLSKPLIMQEIKKDVDNKVKGLDDLSQKTIDELKKIAFSDIKDFMKFDKDGVEFKDSEEVDGTILSEVSSQTTESATKDSSTTRTNLKIKLHDKMKALEMLGKYKSLFVDKLEVDNKPLEVIIKYE